MHLCVHIYYIAHVHVHFSVVRLYPLSHFHSTDVYKLNEDLTTLADETDHCTSWPRGGIQSSPPGTSSSDVTK